MDVQKYRLCSLFMGCFSALVAPVHLQQQRQVVIPPLITAQPLKEIAFREGESLEMTCEGNGEPRPTYRWTMNDQPFDPSGNDGRIAIQPGVGTLIFARPIERDEGIYQCFAENTAGTALSVRVNLREAFLEGFVTEGTRRHTPRLGHALTLSCTPPRSFPNPDILWATMGQGEAFTPIHLTDRVTMDPIGNLHFTNIQPEDYQNGRTYACVVQNMAMRSIRHGEYATVTPQGQEQQFMAPQILWQSPTHQVALRGGTWRVRCIFSGSPTPRVDWARLDDILPLRARIESFGQDLVIRDVQFEDAGRYECQGINDEAVNPIRRSFEFRVQSAPYWTNKPESVSGSEGEKAEFYCEAAGDPSPVYFWFINGIAISQIPADPRRVVERNKITIYNVTREDSQVFQCNSTNKHGYIWENAFLNVLSEPPIILESPEIGQRGAEGSTTTLRCQVFGSPVPQVVWRRGTEQLTGGRFKVLPSGDLEITDLMMIDAGVYTCTATNRFDTVSATGSLIVRRRTRIEQEPLNVFVTEGREAKFTCTGSTDLAEMANYHLDWKKDGTWIDYELAQRVVKNPMDNSLSISGTIVLDTGTYTCVVSNGLDEDEASASLIVLGVPDPPHSVWVLCRNDMRQAEVSWTPGRENDAPILTFIVQYNTSFAPDTWYDVASNVSQNDRRLVVDLSPWGNYTFRVLARNKIGVSPPSAHTAAICRTEPSVPFTNPRNVIGEGDMPDNLVIFWTPTPRLDQNGAEYRYMISWRRADLPNQDVSTALITRQDAWHYVVPETQETYKPFEIRVRAGNSRGESSVEAELVIGYSGEDTPQVTPQDVSVDEDNIGATEVILHWTQVDTSPEIIRGYFRGYRVQFAPVSRWPQDLRDQDFLLRDPSYPRPRIFRRDLGDDVTIKLTHLPPNTDITVQVRVLNKYYAGPPSSPISFTTKEAVPGPPSSFIVRIVGATHLELLWEPPLQPNGVLIGFNISYQAVTGLNLGRLQYRLAEIDPEDTRARLTGLLPETRYRVFLRAVTRQGPGEPIFLERTTVPAGPPNPPTFWFNERTDSLIVVEWQASQTNPGSVFYVQYRPRGATEWWRTPDEGLHMFMEVEGLLSGTTYQVRVVSKNGEGYESPSEWQEVRTEGIAPGHFDLSQAMWFYGIFIALILTIILVVLFVVVKRMHTDMWWLTREQEIEEQIRQLQAEEAARQLGVFNEYGDKDIDYDNDADDQYDYIGNKDPNKDGGLGEKDQANQLGGQGSGGDNPPMKGQEYSDYPPDMGGYRYDQSTSDQSHSQDRHGFDPNQQDFDPSRAGIDQSKDQFYGGQPQGQFAEGYDQYQSYDQDYDQAYYQTQGDSFAEGPTYPMEPAIRFSGNTQADSFI